MSFSCVWSLVPPLIVLSFNLCSLELMVLSSLWLVKVINFNHPSKPCVLSCQVLVRLRIFFSYGLMRTPIVTQTKIVFFYFIWCALRWSFHCLLVTEVSIHAVNWPVRTMCTAVFLLYEVFNRTVHRAAPPKGFLSQRHRTQTGHGQTVQQAAFLPKTVTHRAFRKDVPLQTSLHQVHQER